MQYHQLAILRRKSDRPTLFPAYIISLTSRRPPYLLLFLLTWRLQQFSLPPRPSYLFLHYHERVERGRVGQNRVGRGGVGWKRKGRGGVEEEGEGRGGRGKGGEGG